MQNIAQQKQTVTLSNEMAEGEQDPIFNDFLNDELNLNKLKDATEIIRKGFSHMSLALLSIIN